MLFTQVENSEFTPHDGKIEEDSETLACDKRERAITCVLRRDLYLTTLFLVFYEKICLKEGEVWRKAFSNKIIVTFNTQGLPV